MNHTCVQAKTRNNATSIHAVKRLALLHALTENKQLAQAAQSSSFTQNDRETIRNAVKQVKTPGMSRMQLVSQKIKLVQAKNRHDNRKSDDMSAFLENQAQIARNHANMLETHTNPLKLHENNKNHGKHA